MNKTYGLIWNPARNAWVATPETARRHGKPGSVRRSALAAALLMAGGAMAAGNAPPPQALPTGGQVVAGQATITQTGAQMNVLQASGKAILNWQSFNIGADARVQFQQPGASAVALNRVLGSDPSAIFGRLSANGQVFLVNPNGVLFAPGARVDVGGLVASSLALRDDDFLSGNLRFTRDGSTAAVVNAGDINAGAYAALLAPEVRNEGVIQARAGTVALAAGEAVTLNLSGQRLVDLQVERATVDTLVENRHLVQADGGTVVMSAQSAQALLGRVVNTGLVAADGIDGDGGTLRLSASRQIELGGQLSANAGTQGKGGTVLAIADLGNAQSRIDLNASLQARGGSTGGDGGFIETSGRTVQVGGSAQVDTRAPLGRVGQWLLDPLDFTIAASGGNITGTALSNALASSDVTIQTLDTQVNCISAPSIACGVSPAGGNGDIFVNDSVSWNSAQKLTLSAWRDVRINAVVNVLGNGGALALEIAQAGTTFDFPAGSYFVNAPVTLASGTAFSVKTASDGPALAYTVVRDAAGLAAVAGDLNGRYVLGQDITAPGTSWAPLGNRASPFGGTFDGLGHQISGLTHSNAADDADVGLFGATSILGLVQNLSLDGVNLAGSRNVGAFVGHHLGVLSNAHASGSVTGNASSCSGGGSCSVAVGAIGGLVGFGGGSSQVMRSGSAVNVTATQGDQSGASGSGIGGIGGVVGTLEGSLFGSYASGSVQGQNAVGGLAGDSAGGTIAQSYSRAVVTGSNNTGGLVGRVQDPNLFMPLILASFWDLSTSGQASSGGGSADIGAVGLSTAQMQSPATYTAAGWDTGFDWELRAGQYPMLKQMLQPVFVRADDKLSTFTGSAFNGFSYTSSQPSLTLGGTASYSTTQGGTATAPINVGSYAVLAGGLSVPDSTSPRGWRIEYLPGTLTIDPAVLTVITGSLVGTVSKVYDGSSTVTGLTSGNFSLSGWQGSDGAVVTKTTGSFTDGPNASSSGSRPVTVSLSNSDFQPISNTLLSNYTLPTSVSGNIGSITPKTVTVTASKAYDGSAALSNVAVSTGVGSETLNYSGAAAASKNVGGGNHVSAITLLDGSGLASNYVVNTSAASVSNSVSITPRTVSLSASRVYDGSTTLSGSDVSIDTGVNGEALNYTGATADNKNVSANGSNFIKAITLANGDDGSLVSNYQLPTLNAANAPVTLAQRQVTVSVAGTASKVYDGSTAAPDATGLAFGTLATAPATPTLVIEGLAPREFAFPALSASAQGAAGVFNSKDVDSAATVTHTLNWVPFGTSADLGNYLLPATASGAGTITPRPISATLAGTVSKVYDGTTTAALNFTNFNYDTTGYVAGEAAFLRLDGTQTWQAAQFATANAGNGLTVTVDVAARDYIGFGNFKASNYSFPTTISGAIGSITPRALTVGLTAQSKVYDGNTRAALDIGALTGVLEGDKGKVDLAPYTATFADRNAGENKAVTVSGLALAGDLARNYTVASAATDLTASIRPLDVSLDVTGLISKTYDATTAYTVTQAQWLKLSDQLVAGDAWGSLNLVFASKDAGNRALSLQSAQVSDGNGGRNYSISLAAGSIGSITPKQLTLTGLATGNKVYDGTTVATLSGTAALRSAQPAGSGTATDGAPYAGDAVSLTGTAAGRFDGADVRSGRSVAISGLSINNTNYELVPGTLSAAITPRSLTVVGQTAQGKDYDGSTVAALSGGSLTGLIAADANLVELVRGTGSFADRNAGVNKAVTVSGTGLKGVQAGNYTVSNPTGLTATITPKALTVEGQTAADKVVDGNNQAVVSGGKLAGAITGDDLRLTELGGTFASAAVGTGITVTPNNQLTGSAAGNYRLTSPDLKADITYSAADVLEALLFSVESASYISSSSYRKFSKHSDQVLLDLSSAAMNQTNRGPYSEVGSFVFLATVHNMWTVIKTDTDGSGNIAKDFASEYLEVFNYRISKACRSCKPMTAQEFQVWLLLRGMVK